MHRRQYFLHPRRQDPHPDRRLLPRRDHARNRDRPCETPRHRGDRAPHPPGRAYRLFGMLYHRHGGGSHRGVRDRPLAFHPRRHHQAADGRLYGRGAAEGKGGRGVVDRFRDRTRTLGPHPEEAALFARPSRRMAAGMISLVAVLRDARILRQALRSALLRTRPMDEIDMIRTMETLYYAWWLIGRESPRPNAIRLHC